MAPFVREREWHRSQVLVALEDGTLRVSMLSQSELGESTRLAFLLGAKHNWSMNPTEAARALGQRGGQARAARLSPDQRKKIASLGGKARSLSFHAARRIRENFRYLAAVAALRPDPSKMTRMRTFGGPLPGSTLVPDDHARSWRPPRKRR